jgi:hypothetical protein
VAIYRISESFLAPSHAEIDFVSDVLKHIDIIHSIDEPQSYRVLTGEIGSLGYEGLISWELETIVIDSMCRYKHFVFTHEVGHAIDYMLGGGLGSPMPSESDPLFEQWRLEVTKTRRFQFLTAVRDVLVEQSTGSDWLATKIGRFNNALRYHELWARSYAQYIALSGRETFDQLANGLSHYVHSYEENAAGLYWTGSDFHGVGMAVSDIFEKLGWVPR